MPPFAAIAFLLVVAHKDAGSRFNRLHGMAIKPTIRELCAAGDIAPAELDEIVAAYLREPAASKVSLGDGLQVDLSAAVQESPHAMAILRDRTSMAGAKRYVVRGALLDARPI